MVAPALRLGFIRACKGPEAPSGCRHILEVVRRGVRGLEGDGWGVGQRPTVFVFPYSYLSRPPPASTARHVCAAAPEGRAPGLIRLAESGARSARAAGANSVLAFLVLCRVQ